MSNDNPPSHQRLRAFLADIEAVYRKHGMVLVHYCEVEEYCVEPLREEDDIKRILDEVLVTSRLLED